MTLFACKKEEVQDSLCDSVEVSQEETKKDRKVLIIGIDGFRADALQNSIAPFMYSLSQSEDTYFTATSKTEKATSSGPNWTSLLTGVHQDKHLVVDNGFSEYELNKYPHFMSYIEKVNPSINTASIVTWFPINLLITMNQADYSPVQSTTDSLVMEEVKARLEFGSAISSDVIFLHFDNLDHAGHSTGYHPDSLEYKETLSILDQYVENLVLTIENNRGQGEDWMLFIVSDHGGHLTGHSSYTDNPKVNNTIFFANHPTIKFTSNLENEQVNFVPTVFDYLGIKSEKFDCYTDGISLIVE